MDTKEIRKAVKEAAEKLSGTQWTAAGRILFRLLRDLDDETQKPPFELRISTWVALNAWASAVDSRLKSLGERYLDLRVGRMYSADEVAAELQGRELVGNEQVRSIKKQITVMRGCLRMLEQGHNRMQERLKCLAANKDAGDKEFLDALSPNTELGRVVQNVESLSQQVMRIETERLNEINSRIDDVTEACSLFCHASEGVDREVQKVKRQLGNVKEGRMSVEQRLEDYLKTINEHTSSLDALDSVKLDSI